MALVISGRVHHRHMPEHKIEKVLRKQFPGLVIGYPDFSASRSGCRVEFFCNSATVLDFTIVITSTSKATPAAITLLVREAEALISALTKALSRPFGKYALSYCHLEDQGSRNILLTWSNEAPLTSPAARLSYAICVVLLIICAVLVYGQLQLPQNNGRDYDIMSLIVAIVLPALTVPLPFVFEHIRNRQTTRWLFGTKGGA